ncbi:MAG: hypothetical protein ACLQDL_14990 [Spirochaetia bacterium]
MEQISNEIRVGYADQALNGLLKSIGGERRPFDRRFSQGEDFFINLESPLTVPHFQIHHDVRQPEPSAAYLSSLTAVTEQIVQRAPQVLKGLTYFFDPAEILRPCFYHVYRVGDELFLYMLRVDLMMRAAEGTVVERGTNDTTPAYSSRHLFLEATLIPLEEVLRQGEKVQGFHIRQTISQTWIGEFGRGYFQQGIWMDADLTKFFSKLFLPAEKKTYPYYPYLCRYKTVCQSVIGLDPDARAAAVPLLHRSLEFLLPEMDQIQAEMKNAAFSEQMEIYRKLKGRIPPGWYEAWQDIHVDVYLNESDMREFRVEG